MGNGKRNSRLTPEEKALRGGRGCGVLNELEKTKYLQLISLGFSVLNASKKLGRSNMTCMQSRKIDPEFNTAVLKALKERSVEVVEESCVRLATGEIETVVETYVPLLDDKKNPVIGKDGKAVVRLASRTVRKPAPSLAAQKLFLKANKPDSYGALGQPQPSQELNVNINKDELERLINEKADNLPPASQDSGPQV